MSGGTVFKWIKKSSLMFLHEESLAEHGGLGGMRDEGLLESSLARPQHILADRNEAILAELAAAYAVGIARNHPFNDGNKRAAFVAMGMFLDLHGYVLSASNIEAYTAMLAVSSGDMGEEELMAWIPSYLQPI